MTANAILAHITEWRRGCSCAGRAPEEGRHPVECAECTTALIGAIENAAREDITNSEGFRVPVHGTCKLDDADCPDGERRDCSKHTEPIAFLQQAIERYLDRPGCNIQTRKTAMAKLRWAVQESRR